MNRGDVVVSPFPFQDKLGEKARPAVVVQESSRNRKSWNVVLVMITGNLRDAGRPDNILVDPGTPEGSLSGLSGPSLSKCAHLATVRQQRMTVIGRLSATHLRQLDDSLKAILDLA